MQINTRITVGSVDMTKPDSLRDQKAKSVALAYKRLEALVDDFSNPLINNQFLCKAII